jgi:hypothetical protein
MRLKRGGAPIKSKEPSKEPPKEPIKKTATCVTVFLIEVTPGLEPGNRAFAEPSLTNLGTSPERRQC